MNKLQLSIIYIFIYLFIQCINNINIKIIVNLLFLFYLLKKLDLASYGFNKYKNKLIYLILLVICSFNIYNGYNFNNLKINVLILMIVISILEELLFRSILFNAIKTYKYAILITSLMFSLLHLFNIANNISCFELIIQIIYTFMIGYLFEILYIKTNSIYLPIMGHVFINVCALISVKNMNIYMYFINLIIIITYTIYLSKYE